MSITGGHNDYIIKLENAVTAARVLWQATDIHEERYDTCRAWGNLEDALTRLDQDITEPFDVKAAAQASGVLPPDPEDPFDIIATPAPPEPESEGPVGRPLPGPLNTPAGVRKAITALSGRLERVEDALTKRITPGDFTECPHGTFRILSMVTSCPKCGRG